MTSETTLVRAARVGPPRTLPTVIGYAVASAALATAVLAPLRAGLLPETARPGVVLVVHLVPVIIAVLIHRWHGEAGPGLLDLLAVRTTWLRWRWGLALASVAALTVPILQLVVSTSAGWSPWGPSPAAKAVVTLVPAMAASASIAAIGEELGWRGYLQSITAHWGFWRSATAVSAAWTACHLPLVTFAVTTDGVPARVAVAAMLTLAFASFALVALRDRMGSVWPAVWAHGLFGSAVVWLHDDAGAVETFATVPFWLFTLTGWVGWLLTAAVIRRHP